MKTKDENRLTMFDGVKTVFTVYNSIVITITALKAVSLALAAIISAIHAADSLATSSAQGSASNKKLLKNTAVDIVYPIVAALFALADKNSDTLLEAKTNYAESALRKTPDEVLPSLLDNFLALATTNSVVLASDYDINAAYLTAAAASVTAYETSIGTKESDTATQKTQNKNISDLVKSGSKLLRKQGDKIMRGQKTLNADFYNTYKNARKIDDLGVHHTTIKGKVTDSITGLPLYAVVVSILGTSLSALADVNGVYIIQKFKGGVYKIEFRLDGYQTLVIPNVEIKVGKAIELNVQLVKL